MHILFEWGILGLLGLLIYGVLRVLVHSWRKAVKNYNKKLSEDYVRAVENHQLSDMRMSTYPDPPPKRKFDRDSISPSYDGEGHGGSFGGGGTSRLMGPR